MEAFLHRGRVKNTAYNETPTKGRIMFLKNREIRIRMAKTPQNEDATPETEERFKVEPEQLNAIAKDFMKYSAIVIGCVIAASVVLHTISELIIQSANKD